MSGTSPLSINLTGKRYMSDIVYAMWSVGTLGIFYILCKLSNKIEILLATIDCELSEANCVVMEDQYNNKQIFFVKRLKVKNTPGLVRYIRNSHCRVIDTPYCRFIYDYKLCRFVSPSYTNAPRKLFNDIYKACLLKTKATEDIELYEKKVIYGENNFRIDLPSNFQIIKKRFFEPILLWEIFSICVWISISYIKYTIVVGCIYIYIFFSKVRRDIIARND